MNIYILTLLKSVCMSLPLQLLTMYIKKNWKYEVYSYVLLQVSFNILLLVYIKWQSDRYITKFLRKRYNPTWKLLIPAYVIDITLISLFYIKIKSMVVLSINIVLLIIIDAFSLIGKKSRKAVALERNEEFFKIGYLKDHFKFKDVVCLNRGELVQILKKQGDYFVVRKSGINKVYTVPAEILDDDIDLTL